MNFRTNVILGWVLAVLFVGLGLSMAGKLYFKQGRPEKMGYPIEGVVEEGAGGGAAAAPAVPIETLMASAEVTKGEAVFKKCASCHNAQSGGANGIGPNLYGIVGHQVAAHPGFAYSDALKAKGGTWTFAALNEWLTNPRKYAEGTKMSFAGLTNPEDRANVIAYLNAQGSNLPIPAAAPAAPGPDTTQAPGDTTAADAGNAATPADGNSAAPAK
ncbi:MAG: cytochrome C [Proteobacteria bacterium SG_bin6]|nr:MAG: cytochrome C [Proteobacteria bacterium SG_bin6]